MINQHNYNEILESKVFPWVNSKYAGAPYTFQQDGVPAHMAKLVQDWCRENLSHFWRKEMWPPPSPDFNPMDFEMLSMLEAKACNVSHSFIPILKAKLEAVWADIPAEDLRANSA